MSEHPSFLAPGAEVTVLKLDPEGREIWRWRGHVVACGETCVRIEARFSAKVRDLGYVVFRRGDRFVEWYYSDRWYNIFEVHDAADDSIKGWYCNINRPARFGAGVIEHEDLALDLFVHPDGRIVLDDEDEFAARALDAEDREAGLAAAAQLRAEVAARHPPFDAIPV
jgi:predicted RNA-binding protein associated with RNAse of E/G family